MVSKTAAANSSFGEQEVASLEFTEACKIVAGTFVDISLDSTATDTDIEGVNNR